MSMKKTISSTVLAAALGVTVVGAVNAASAVNVQSTIYSVNGIEASIETISQNGKTLASVRDLGEALGADITFAGSIVTVTLNGHTVVLSKNSDNISVDGIAQKLTAPVTNVKYKNYIELDAYIKSLGGTVELDASGVASIETTGELLEDADRVDWLDVNRLIVSKDTEAGRVDYLLNVHTGKFEELLNNPNASELVVSPNGKKAAFTDNTGAVYVIDLATKASAQVSADTNIKPELVWSADSNSIYFLQGDKGSVIVKLDTADGKLTKVLEDKVDYKSNLNVSSNGNLFTYIVTKPGAVTAPSDKPVDADDVAIDTTGTEPQIYSFDATEKDGKPVKLTTNSEDKVFFQASDDGHFAYFVSVPTDGNSVLSSVGKSQALKVLLGDKDVLQSLIIGGKAYVLTSGPAGSNLISIVDTLTGESKLLYTVSDSVSEIAVSAGGLIAIVQDGKTYVNESGNWKQVTR
ncbi:stalk domain-containing protein [Cohnella faecalis]|uniref:Copper amine oxidase-like N-terminal domain-containing protein n=1 Tax=Cohnella faecalis TaxID=2315694 RepID=A0A398CV47_9BACL|nr:stalk domain-containing protein [Cohnella faecalis]RIE02904.1 hypothetical protein D3H35_20020 [Cohnella faecalis]